MLNSFISLATIAVTVSVLAAPMAAADIVLPSGVTVAPGESRSLALTLAAPSEAGVIVNLKTSDASKVTVNPASVHIPAGATTPSTMPEITGLQFGSANISASGAGLTGGTETVQVAATLFGPQSALIARGATRNLTFVLSSRAPAPVSLSLRSADPAVADVPATVTIPAGETTMTVPVSGRAAGSSLVSISGPPEIGARTVTIAVAAPNSITLPIVSTAVGKSTPFPILLGSPAPPSGVTVTLASSNTLYITVSPKTVFVPGGSTVPSIQPKVNGVRLGYANITASAPGYVTASQVVTVPATLTFSPTAMSIQQGTSQRLFMMLSEPAPWGEGSLWGPGAGVFVKLSSSNPNVAAVPPSITMYPDGSAFATVVFLVTGLAPGTAVIRASSPPFIPEITATVTVLGPGGSGPKSIAATGGTPQSATIHTAFGAQFAATVRDSSGNPVPGVTVTFNAPSAGASGTFAAGQNQAATNASGVATAPAFTANSLTGTYVVTASATGVSGSASFVLTNTAASSPAINLPSSVVVGPNQSVPTPVTLTVPAPAGGITVALASSDPSKVTITPASVFIAAGATSPAVHPQVNGVNFGFANISASAPGYSSATRSVTVSGALGFSPATLTINGTSTHNLALTLSAPAPSSGLTVSLTSSSAGVVTLPATVTFAANATSVNVPVTGVASGSITITAQTSAPNVSKATAAVTVKAGSDIMLASGVTVAPRESRSLTITLAKPSSTGVLVTLSSSDTSKVTIRPASLFIPAGATGPYTQPLVTGVNFGTANITASAAGLTGDTQPVRVAANLIGPSTVTITRGSSQNLTFVVSAPVPAALTIALVSDHPTIASVPASVTIPANGTTAVVPITGIAAGSTTVRVGAAPNVEQKTVDVTVIAPGAITLPSVTPKAGESVPFPITLGTPAPPVGVTVTLVSSNTAIVTVSPATVFIPGGATAPLTQPRVTGVRLGAASITASAPGYVTATQVVAVPATLTFSPPSLVVRRGTQEKLIVVLSQSAPWGPGSDPWGPGAGVIVQLTSSNPSVATVPANIALYPDGSSFSSSVFLVTGANPGTTIIRASAPPFIPEVTATVTVVP